MRGSGTLDFVYLPSKSAAIAALLAYAASRSVGDLNVVSLLCHIAGEKRRSTAVGPYEYAEHRHCRGVFPAGMLNVGPVECSLASERFC